MRCDRCQKPTELCVCADVRPLATRLHALILQHPQEPGEPLGTARLAQLCLPNSTLKVGLSWPNLARALGRETVPSRWAVLYLGSGIVGGGDPKPGLQFVSRKGAPLPSPKPEELEGIVVLDGTWSQAKALWWRNAWLLKLRRVVLVPAAPSLYRGMRKEPRRECVSTLESLADCLVALGEPAEVGEGLRTAFRGLLRKAAAHRHPKAKITG
jgi:DTW domain-containing protein YfiP